MQTLHAAKTDERVRGVMAVLGGRENFGGMAQLQELRNALLDFRVRRVVGAWADAVCRSRSVFALGCSAHAGLLHQARRGSEQQIAAACIGPPTTLQLGATLHCVSMAKPTNGLCQNPPPED